jgi:hypothetical protein
MASGVEKVSLIAALMAFCQDLFQNGLVKISRNILYRVAFTLQNW